MKSRTKQSSTSAAITATTKAAATCDSPKHYPSISAAYWLPAPNPTPYLLPGKVPILSLIARLSEELPVMFKNSETIKKPRWSERNSFSFDGEKKKNFPSSASNGLTFSFLTKFILRAQVVRGHVEQEVQRERCKTNVLQPWYNRGVYGAAWSVRSKQGMRFCDFLNQTICHRCY